MVIPAYNCRATLRRAINSVLAQDSVNFEVIVVDDGSRDGTNELVREICAQNGRVKLVEHAVNMGPAAARNTGIEAARGEWVGLLDADDAWLPKRAKRLIAIARRRSVDIVADNQWLFDPGAQSIVRKGFSMRPREVPFDVELLLRNNVSGGCFIFGWLKPFISREFINRLALRYDATLRYGEDFDFYVRMFACGARGVLARDAYYIYTQRTGSATGTKSLYSRTEPDMKALVTQSSKLLDQLRGTSSPRAMRLMRRQIRHLGGWPHALQVRKAIRERRYSSAFLITLRYPSAASAALLALRTRLRQRIGLL
ncbi:glycosyltransferase family 2 protein [Salinisphaera sp.]|uniref:glycosyltransferase family 2 protein n=1 Tax=Salinisphaera sp. TaxID=1914330 RepID=UPI002D7835C4|nr:glycosyltransferase family 2 protein [Salinisphaera sp.]HET7313235.1 glycosyltransferase family 2 protein [Salinisphaera sp.]